MTEERSGPARREQRALLASIVVSLVLGGVALVWGLAGGSQVILLDGVYTVLDLGMSWLALYASHLVAVGPTPRFHFGRDSLVPLVVGVQGLALSGMLVYAAVEAVRVILGGGSEVPAAGLVVYGAVSGLVALATWAYMLRRDPTSDLVKVEAAVWLTGAVDSLVITVGGRCGARAAYGWVVGSGAVRRLHPGAGELCLAGPRRGADAAPGRP
jgi:predicted Co/Zn/Cd cation transporter (cation efflux family)